jgi:hypothetical protein
MEILVLDTVVAMKYVLKIIASARRRLYLNDPDLAVYMVRDLPETKAAGLDDLCWALHHGSATRREAEDVLDRLEEWVKKEQRP